MAVPRIAWEGQTVAVSMVGFRSLLVGGLSMAAVLGGTASPDPAAASPRVSDRLFGVHMNSLGQRPSPVGSSTLRIWTESGATWRKLQPNPGAIDWSALDRVISNAHASGVTNISYVLGATPLWAASGTSKSELLGPGSASHPRQDSYYLDFLRALVTRYQGQISSFQVWNEADLPDFYNGSPAQLAKLTQAAYRVIKSVDRHATVIAAGAVPRPGRFGPGSFEDRYFRGLKRLGWPVDAYAFTFYPENANPSQRRMYLGIAKAALRRLKAPRRQIWESEVNYFSNGRGLFAPSVQATLVARTYIDSMELGIARSYWYVWDGHWAPLGVRTVAADGTETAAAKAYRSVRSWMVGKRWRGCRADRSRSTWCRMGNGRRASAIVFRNKGSRWVSAGKTWRTACSLDGSCQPLRAGAKIRITREPIYLARAVL